MRLRQFIEQLQQLEQTFGGDLPVEVGGMTVLPPVINPIIGRYTVAIYCDTNYAQLDEDEEPVPREVWMPRHPDQTQDGSIKPCFGACQIGCDPCTEPDCPNTTESKQR